MDADQLLRPRWGTFSVMDHLNPARLIPEILLYDRLVFPVPTDAADRQRWAGKDWNPEMLDERLKELKGLVHATPWTTELRGEWSARWERIKKAGRDTEGIARGLTPVVLASSVFQDRVPPPIMIAAYQESALAEADLELTGVTTPRDSARDQLDRGVRALFERRLDMPVVMHPRKTYDQAIELAHNPEYQQARRSLFAWEDQVLAAGWPTGAAIRHLEDLVDAHDEFIKVTFVSTVKRRIFRVAEFAAEAAIGASIGDPVIGLAAAGSLKLAAARLPSILPEPGQPLAQPGAALHKAISVMFHDR